MANIDLLDQQKPSEMQNDFTDIEMGDDGLVLRNARFKTRVRASETVIILTQCGLCSLKHHSQTSIVLDTENGHRLVGHAIHVKGKTTTIKLRRGQFRGGIQTVRVVGREEPTNAECARDGFVLRLLRGEATLTNAFIQLLWFPDRASSSLWGYPDPYNAPAFAHLDLNPSQMRVAGAMIAKIGALVIAHGKSLQADVCIYLFSTLNSRPSWNGQNQDDLRFSSILATIPLPGLGHRPIECCCKEYCRKLCEALHRLQVASVERVLRRVVCLS